MGSVDFYDRYDFSLSEDGTRAFVSTMAFSRVNESSLGRIKKHIDGGFISISAYRTVDKDGKTVSDKENFENTKKLVALIRDAGLGYIRMMGGWKDEDSDKTSYEQSFFIPYMDKYSEDEFEALAIKWADKFRQKAYIISLPSDEGKIRLMESDTFSKPYKKGETFSKQKLTSESDFFSYLVKGSHRGMRKGQRAENKSWQFVSESDIFLGYRIPTDSLCAMSMAHDPYEIYLWRRGE